MGRYLLFVDFLYGWTRRWTKPDGYLAYLPRALSTTYRSRRGRSWLFLFIVFHGKLLMGLAPALVVITMAIFWPFSLDHFPFAFSLQRGAFVVVSRSFSWTTGIPRPVIHLVGGPVNPPGFPGVGVSGCPNTRPRPSECFLHRRMSRPRNYPT